LQYSRIIFREADIIFNQETDSEIRKIEIVRIMGYKVVHEWFYYAIDPYKWEPWLSKGFATFFGIYAADKVILYLFYINYFNHTHVIRMT